ncbi:hypothetical protein BRC86_12895 [Halobacteriales archaeon QS_3_64_16]|nr:MAG: hypothetical protein BRC86_12895 [Halobacteriales archaeon QS_3_64_16]
MITAVELGAIAVVLLALLLFARLLSVVRPLLVNTVVGLLAFVLASLLGVEVAVSAFVIALVALGGLPGALVVILLSALDVAFVPAVLAIPF